MDTSRDSSSVKNMRVGLIIFGSLTIALGVLCLLIVPLMFLSTLIPVKGQDPIPVSFMLPGALLYLGIAVVDVFLGIGSIQCKRWARRLLLLWSLFWLLSGLFSMIGLLIASDQINIAMAQSSEKIPASVVASMKTAMFVFSFLFYVVLPGSFIWFYSLRNTRLTCEERYPVPSWTDRCPFLVLTLALWSGLCALCLPIMLLYAPVFPFFGTFIQGPPAIVILLGLSAAYAWLGWSLYHQKPTAWWASLGLMLFLTASYMVTFAQGGLMVLYQHMNMPAQTMKILEATPLLQSRWIGWIGFLFVLPYMALMLYARRYFKISETEKVSD